MNECNLDFRKIPSAVTLLGKTLGPEQAQIGTRGPIDHCVILGLWSPLNCDLREARTATFFFWLVGSEFPDQESNLRPWQ